MPGRHLLWNPEGGIGLCVGVSHFPLVKAAACAYYYGPGLMAADGSVYALWPLATVATRQMTIIITDYYMTPTCAWMTKPSLAMRPTGLMEQRVLARDSGPSVTLEMVYSASSTCTQTCEFGIV